YTINLRMAGFKPRFVGSARVMGPVPHGYRAMRSQRLRWEGGRWHVVRRHLFPLLRHALRRDPSRLDAALDLAVPPLRLLALVGLSGAAAGAGFRLAGAWSSVPWLLADAAIFGFVALGFWSARAPAAVWRALVESPRFLLWKLLAYARIAAGVDAHRWDRSERPAASSSLEADASQTTGRVHIADVPIDHVGMAGGVDRPRRAPVHPRQHPAATRNPPL